MSRSTAIIAGVCALLVGIFGIAIAILVPAAGGTPAPTAAQPAGGVTVAQGPAQAPSSTAPTSIGPATSTVPALPQATVIAPPSTVGAKGPHRHVTLVSPDGCDRAYGTFDQCIPKRAPGGKKVTCAYLTPYGFFAKPLVVRADPLHLMGKPHVAMFTDSAHRMVISSCSDT